MSSDVACLREKMHLLEKIPDLSKTLGLEARRYVVANHSLARFERKWAGILVLAVKRYEHSGHE